MSPSPAPSPLKSLLRDLGGLAVPIAIALSLLVLSIWLESPPGTLQSPLSWLAGFDNARAGALLGVAAQLVCAAASSGRLGNRAIKRSK